MTEEIEFFDPANVDSLVESKEITSVEFFDVLGGSMGGGGGGGGITAVYGEIPTGTINGVNTIFSTIFAFTPNLLAVFLNGIRLRRTNDYTEIGSNTFQLVTAPLSGDSLSVDYIKP
jgi:hypothetical protein